MDRKNYDERQSLNYMLLHLSSLQQEVYGSLSGSLAYFGEIKDSQVEFDYQDEGINKLIERIQTEDDPSMVYKIKSVLMEVKEFNREYLIPFGFKVFSKANNPSNIEGIKKALERNLNEKYGLKEESAPPKKWLCTIN